MRYKRRWYDKNPELSDMLSQLEKLSRKDRDQFLIGINNLIDCHDPELIERHILDFPLLFNRRWYGKDPYSWVTINSLQYVDNHLMNEILKYFKKQIYKVKIK